MDFAGSSQMELNFESARLKSVVIKSIVSEAPVWSQLDKKWWRLSETYFQPVL